MPTTSNLEDRRKAATPRRKIAIWIAVAVCIAGAATVLFILQLRARTVNLTGVVLSQDADPRKQQPIPNVEITVRNGPTAITQKSDSAGFFRLRVPIVAWLGEETVIEFRHPGYRQVDLTERLQNHIYAVRMSPIPRKAASVSNQPEVTITDVRVRYAEKATTPINIGSTVKTFEVANIGGIPCDNRPPCSPDARWKATIGGVTLDAGEGQEFRNVRVSCIAGPCPFTKVESDQFLQGGRVVKVFARDWSDEVTFLVEAEVIRTTLSDQIRQAYPAIFGRVLSFTLPPTGEGPSIEADMNGTEIIFPLGPDLNLSWAVCNIQTVADRTKLYSCELKPGYRFP